MLKKIALFATGLVLIGLVGIVSTAAVHRQSISQYVTSFIDAGATSSDTNTGGQNFDQSKSVDGQSVNSVQVTASMAAVHVYPGTSNQIQVHAYGYLVGVRPSDFTFKVEETGHQVTVSLQKHPGFSVGFNTIRLHLDVALPQHLYDQIIAEASAGKVNIDNLTAKNFTLHSSAGAVVASNLTGQVRASTSAGSVTVNNVKGDVNLESSAGAVAASAIDGNIQAHSSAGSVQIHLPDITHNITAGSSAGSVRITTANAPKALQFSLQASVGSVHFGLANAQFTVNKRSDVEGSIGQGGPMLTVQSSAGSVDVSEGPVS